MLLRDMSTPATCQVQPRPAVWVREVDQCAGSGRGCHESLSTTNPSSTCLVAISDTVLTPQRIKRCVTFTPALHRVGWELTTGSGCRRPPRGDGERNGYSRTGHFTHQLTTGFANWLTSNSTHFCPFYTRHIILGAVMSTQINRSLCNPLNTSVSWCFLVQRREKILFKPNK